MKVLEVERADLRDCSVLAPSLLRRVVGLVVSAQAEAAVSDRMRAGVLADRCHWEAQIRE